MKKTIKLSLFLIIIFVMTFILTGCKNKDKNNNIKDKISNELDFLDNKIVYILNKLNNLELENYTIVSEEIQMSNNNSEESDSEGKIKQDENSGNEKKQTESQNSSNSTTQNNSITITEMKSNTVISSDENDVNWNTIKKEVEIINETWNIIILDLTSLKVNNNDILNCSTIINDIILSAKSENKKETLANTAKLYSFIPKLEQEIDQNETKQSIKQVKAYLINAYSLLETDNWNEIEKIMANAEVTFKNVINDIEYTKNKEYKVNKTYILLKELQNSLSYKDKKLFLIKYKNLMESMNTL